MKKNKEKEAPSLKDFDTLDIEPLPKVREDEEDLGLDDYYDELLYEKTKTKKKHEIEDALKELKNLKKKTKHLEELIGLKQKNLKNKKTNDKKRISKPSYKYMKKEHSELEDEVKTSRRNAHKRNQFGRTNNRKKYSLEKYEGDLFEKSPWNDLIAADNANNLI